MTATIAAAAILAVGFVGARLATRPERRRRRPRPTPLRRRQLEREVADSDPVVWRR